MPALITHYLHADSVLKRIELPDKSAPAFLLGTQGPDFLYFHRAVPIIMPGKSLRALGTTLHNITADRLFICFAKYCLDDSNDEYARGYALGFICHYAMDYICHPFVYAKQESIIKAENITYFNGCVHSRIEHAIDVIMLREMTGERGNVFDFDKALTNDKSVLCSCGKMVADALNALTDSNVTAKQMIRGFKDLRALQKFSRDPLSLKYYTVRGAERLLFIPKSLSTFVRRKAEDSSFDYADLKHNIWRDPFDDTEDDRSFIDMFNESVDVGVELVNEFERHLSDGVSDIDFTGNYSYKTGLKITSADGMDNTYKEG